MRFCSARITVGSVVNKLSIFSYRICVISFFQVEKVFRTFFTMFMPTGSCTNYNPSGFLFVKGFYLFSSRNQHIQVVFTRIIFIYLFSRGIFFFLIELPDPFCFWLFSWGIVWHGSLCQILSIPRRSYRQTILFDLHQPTLVINLKFPLYEGNHPKTLTFRVI